MDITPTIPDGYNGPIKQLTCRICKHIFYIAQDDYHRLSEVRFCHECSLIVLEELQRNQATSIPNVPRAIKEHSVVSSSTRSLVQSPPPIHIPQPRTIDRGKMTVKQLLEEAQMLRKTWRYKQALFSYEDAIQRNPQCVDAYLAIALIFTKHLKKYDQALKLLDKALKIRLGDFDLLFARAITLKKLMRYEESNKEFQHLGSVASNKEINFLDQICRFQ
jgi:tetratricopeptide (TPR) repeat protein